MSGHAAFTAAELVEATGHPWVVNSRHGTPELSIPGTEYTILVVSDDDTYRLYVRSGGRAKLGHTDARISGVAARAVLLGALAALVKELSS